MINPKRLLLAVFFIGMFGLSLIGCKTLKTQESKFNLIGGQEIPEDRWPSVRKLKIYIKEPNGIFSQKSDCTMTFIKPNLAVTAAHCLCKGQRFVYSEKERWEDFVAIRSLIHPSYRCDVKTPNAFDIGLVWFAEKVAMPTSRIIDDESPENLEKLRLVGYGKTILKITGSFWMANRKPMTESQKPSPRKGETEFDGKHEGEATWSGEKPRDQGFIRLSAVYDVKREINEPMTEVASAEGDSGGPAFTMGRDEILGLISRGGMTFSGVGSERVEVITELIDLRRSEIRQFLIDNGALAQSSMSKKPQE